MPKKLITLALAALGGLMLRRQLATRRTEQDLWTEATDPVDLR